MSGSPSPSTSPTAIENAGPGRDARFEPLTCADGWTNAPLNSENCGGWLPSLRCNLVRTEGSLPPSLGEFPCCMTMSRSAPFGTRTHGKVRRGGGAREIIWGGQRVLHSGREHRSTVSACGSGLALVAVDLGSGPRWRTSVTIGVKDHANMTFPILHEGCVLEESVASEDPLTI